MNSIFVLSPIIKNNEIIVPFDCSLGLKKYFSTFQFSVSYSEDMSDVPPSLAVIPLISNLLPLVWLTDSVLQVECLDEAFYNSIQNFKEGYKAMYPHMHFNGQVEVRQLIQTENTIPQANVATFFSGGVDAFATLIAHIQEKPTLLTVRGADIALDDQMGWDNVTQHVEATSIELDCNFIYIASNFKCFLNYASLSNLIVKSGDNWWHGFQHGIGLLGLAAPIAYKKGFTTIYIASSYTAADHVTCASHPSIDNCVKYASCQIKHDQYECTRQNKVTHICDFVRNSGKNINLRVCWESRGGKNCGVCEKCLRTIYAILAEGENPEEMGFPEVSERYKEMKEIIQKRIIFNFISIPYWQDIQKRFIENKNLIPYNAELDWIYTFDFPNANRTLLKQIKIGYQKIRRSLGIVKRKLFQ